MFIAGDWGTTQLRLYLCDGAAVIDRVNGPGIGALSGSPESTFVPLTAGWAARHKGLSAHLCGMVGSRNGWVETPYVKCPADLSALRAGVVKFEAAGFQVSIVPGLSCTNPLGAPDVMRGEETQIFGALAGAASLGSERRLFALPGTHTKWAVVENGVLKHFLTSPTGELFALLKDHSTLARAGGAVTEDSPEGFMRGVARQADVSEASLTHVLFETRSRQLLDGMSKSEAMSFLSGLLIGTDVTGASRWFEDKTTVTLIGDAKLNELYARALAFHGFETISLSGEECALNGLRAVIEGNV
jgi:2-dehydro-3-deoxygalactonokinase